MDNYSIFISLLLLLIQPWVRIAKDKNRLYLIILWKTYKLSTDEEYNFAGMKVHNHSRIFRIG